MRIVICAVGRLRAGPEKDLVEDYLSRCARAGRGLGIGPATVLEVEAKRGGGPAEEAALLRRSLPRGAKVIALDERGTPLTSIDFSRQLAAWRDQGAADAACLIGGADGLDPELAQGADLRVSFGKMVWPHMLARVMLAEQLYRATQILAGTPYHRA